MGGADTGHSSIAEEDEPFGELRQNDS
jgi:hypothetical protein